MDVPFIIADDVFKFREVMNEGRREAVEGAHVEIRRSTYRLYLVDVKKLKYFMDIVNLAMFVEIARKVTNIVIIWKVVINAVLDERNDWLDSQKESPQAELTGSDDESLSWERGVRANLEEFVPCHLESLYEHAQETEIAPQDSSQATEIQSAGEPSRVVHQAEEVQRTEWPPLDLHDQNVPFHRFLVVDLSPWESEFRTEIIDDRTCLVITHQNRPYPPPSP
ncbi:hypothetical protein INT45_007931 [Circinella minor]|uniref:Uncharacterized protein n=1 Tax=Circinella minor TaxID=1195481 RepID=A0A8H7SAM8_9FUNG|nr:hypothetical protein INT45_007931 [Circinella minor]